MLPHGGAALSCEHAELVPTQGDQAGAFLLREVCEVWCQTIAISLAPHDVVFVKHVTRHPLDDVDVILELTLVVRQNGGSDVTDGRGAALQEQSLQHDGLVDVLHLHRRFKKGA